MEEFAREYANALYGLIEPKDGGIYADALKAIGGVFAANPEYYRLLCSYSLSQKEKEELLDNILGKLALPVHLITYLKVISAHHRLTDLSAISNAFYSLVNAENGVKEGIAYSAVKLTPEALSSIEKALQKRVGGKVELKNEVDHTLLGGVKVALEGKVYDGTLRGKLNELQRQLHQGGNAQ